MCFTYIALEKSFNYLYDFCVQITIAYVSEHMSKSERVDALADYGFVCECKKCCLE